MEEITTVRIMCVGEDLPHTSNSELLDGHCGHKVWVTPTSIKQRDIYDASYICDKCRDAFVEIDQMAGESVSFCITKEALDDIERDLGLEARLKAEAIAFVNNITIVP